MEEGEEPNDKSIVVATLLSMPHFQYPFLVMELCVHFRFEGNVAEVLAVMGLIWSMCTLMLFRMEYQVNLQEEHSSSCQQP